MKIGDKVSFVDEKRKGEIISIDGDLLQVLVGDFIQTCSIYEVVVRQDSFTKAVGTIEIFSKDTKKEKLPNKKYLDSSDRVIDLHSSALPDRKNKIKGHDILLYQLETAQNALQNARRKKISNITFIHGNGAGVLKGNLEEWLNSLDYVSYSDASYRLYGQGAIDVKIYKPK